MNAKRAVIALFLCIIMALSFAAIMQKQKRELETSGNIASLERSPSIYNSLLPSSAILSRPFAIPLFSGIAAEVASDSLPYNCTRAEILNTIIANPGIHFREICASLGLSIGLAEYHLGVLKRAGLVSFFRDGRYKRYFASRKFSSEEMATISLLKHKTAAKIFKILLEKPTVSHGEMASQLGVTSQALTWQIQHLRKANLILQVEDGLKSIYSLDVPSVEVVSRCLFLATGTWPID